MRNTERPVSKIPFTPQQWEAVAEAKARALTVSPYKLFPEDFPEVRPEILLSWKRSLLAGVSSTETKIPIEREFNPDSTLVQAAEPIMDRLAVQVASFGGWAFLTDQHSRLMKVVLQNQPEFIDLDGIEMTPGMFFSEDAIGTNGIGISRELEQPFLVSGTEHFRSPETITTTGVPIVDPVTRRLMGTLGIHCRREYASGSLLPLVTELGRSIENQLLRKKPDSDREIFEAFIDVRRRYSGPVIAMSHDIMLSTGSARQLYGPADGPLIESIAREAASQSQETSVVRTLSGGKNVEFRSLPVAQPKGGFAAILLLQVQQCETSSTRTKNNRESIIDVVEKALRVTNKVLLTGERGTGKEWLVNNIFDSTSISLSTVDCATDLAPLAEEISAIQRVLDSGTAILLRHIEETPRQVRQKLGMLIRNTDATVIATCSEGSKEDTQYAHLMESFHAVVRIPPLRERISDIPDMCREILSDYADETDCDFIDGQKRHLSTKALGALLGQDWPGNIRQLKQVLYTAALRSSGPKILEEALPPAYRSSAAGGNLTLMERVERQTVQSVLNSCDGNRDTAAARLGISRATMYRKLRRYQLS